jgi:HAD superfamily hydrolase (TIGR01509 family)
VAVLFDVDGTLVDTTYLHTVCWWQALRRYGLTVPAAEIHRGIGMGSDHLLEKLLGADRDRDRDSELSSDHDALFAAYWPNLVPLEGAAELLRECHERGWRVVLATSAKRDELNAMRAALDAEDAIDEITSADDVEASKPAPDIVERALESAGVSAERAVFIGDTRWDVEAAERAGVACIGMLSGGWSSAELREAGAAAVCRNPAALRDGLDELIGERFRALTSDRVSR